MNNIKTYRQRNNPETQRDRIPNYYEDAICPVYYFLCLTTEAKSHQNEKEKKKTLIGRKYHLRQLTGGGRSGLRWL